MPRIVDFDPFAEETAAPPPASPEAPGLIDRIGDMFTGRSRTEFPDAPEFKPAYMESTGYALDEGLGAIDRSAVTPDPQAQLDILKKAIPDLETKTDKHGNIMLKTSGMKDFTYLNKPGASARDMDEFGTQTLATLPILGWAGGARTLPGLMMRGAGGGAAASVAQDVAATGQGSEQGIDPGRAVVTGAIGGTLPGAVTGAGMLAGGIAAGARSVGDSVRKVIRPEAQAGRQAQREVQGAFATDSRVGGLNPISTGDRVSAANRGQDLRVMDFGGETTRALGRKTANISPAARDMLMRVITPRSEKMIRGRRGESLIENEFGLSRSTELARQELSQQARDARAPLYRAAYQQGAGGLDSPTLQQLQGSPIFQRAMAAAERRVQDQAATPGWASTGVRGQSGHYTLEFWDQTKRVLDDYAGEAARGGRNHEAELIRSMARSLRNEADARVPLYAQARGTATTFFGQDEALEAGATFARGGRYNMDDARRAFQALNPAERNLFQEGFADVLVQRIRQNPNYLNQIRDIPAEFDRVQLALGPQRFAELEGFLRIEQIMQRIKDAMGNSTTARQLNEMNQKFGDSLWGADGNATAGGLTRVGPAMMIANLLTMGGKRAQGLFDRRVAEEVAQLLTTSDPEVFLRGVQQAGQGPILNAIRAFDYMLTDAGIPQATPFAVQAGVNAHSYDPEPPRATSR